MNERGEVKVLDFGLAKRMLQESADSLGTTAAVQQTQEGHVLGTPRYMSPEQAVGKAVDHRSDLFSLGSVIYFLLTGRPPFAGANLGEVLDNVVHKQPEAIARFHYDVPPELERITLKLLAKQVDRRYQSARDLLVDLKNLLRDLDHAGTPHSTVAAPPSPKEIAQSDIVITYANLDDQPVISGRQGWVSQFEQNLQLRVAQLSGKQVAVVKQPDVSDSAEIESAVLKQMPNAKTVVSVLSPPFARSNGCHRIVGSFWKSARRPDSSRSAIAVAVVECHQDAGGRRRLAPRPSYALHRSRSLRVLRARPADRAGCGNSTRRSGTPPCNASTSGFMTSPTISPRCSNTWETLRTRAKSEPQIPKTIFLAATTSDLEPQRDQLRRELIELGHTVVPKQPLPLVASELVAAVQSCLEQADVAIHFVGEHFGLVPEATDLSMVALQNQVAARFCENKPLKRLIWIPKGLQPRDQRQSSFIRQLESDPRSVTGAELIADTLENLKVLLRTRWEREQAERDKPPPKPSTGGAPRVYLICDQNDEAALEPLEDFFYDQGIEVSLPGFEAEESEVQQIHIQNLRDCDAALIYYGAAGMHWVDFKIRDLQKAAGYRDSRPIPVSAVYVAPPFNHRKERFKSVSTEVVPAGRRQFRPELLTGFVAAVRQVKEAG